VRLEPVLESQRDQSGIHYDQPFLEYTCLWAYSIPITYILSVSKPIVLLVKL